MAWGFGRYLVAASDLVDGQIGEGEPVRWCSKANAWAPARELTPVLVKMLVRDGKDALRSHQNLFDLIVRKQGETNQVAPLRGLAG
jgi:hypothetical protein